MQLPKLQIGVDFPVWKKVPGGKATGNSRFETENPPAQRKIPENSRCLSSLIITVSAIPARFIMACIPYVVFMGRDVGYCVLSVLPLFSPVLILTVNL